MALLAAGAERAMGRVSIATVAPSLRHRPSGTKSADGACHADEVQARDTLRALLGSTSPSPFFSTDEAPTLNDSDVAPAAVLDRPMSGAERWSFLSA